MTKRIAPGFNFLHSHPMKEGQLGLDMDHVIVDREDWEKVIRYFIDNPERVEELKETIVKPKFKEIWYQWQ